MPTESGDLKLLGGYRERIEQVSSQLTTTPEIQTSLQLGRRPITWLAE
jgi:hypothetical protein